MPTRSWTVTSPSTDWMSRLPRTPVALTRPSTELRDTFSVPPLTITSPSTERALIGAAMPDTTMALSTP